MESESPQQLNDSAWRATMEISLKNLASKFDSFLAGEERNRKAMWDAIAKSAQPITWGKIMAFISAMAGVIYYVVMMNTAYGDLKLKNVEDVAKASQKAAERYEDLREEKQQVVNRFMAEKVERLEKMEERRGQKGLGDSP